MVFALSVLDWYPNKEGLIHPRRGGVTVAGSVEWAVSPAAFGDVGHNVPTTV